MKSRDRRDDTQLGHNHSYLPNVHYFDANGNLKWQLFGHSIVLTPRRQVQTVRPSQSNSFQHRRDGFFMAISSALLVGFDRQLE